MDFISITNKEHVNTIPKDWDILLVTPIVNPNTPNFISKNDNKGKYRWIDAFHPAMGIRFIFENYEGVRILEYPTMDEFENELKKGVDVVGISFLTIQMYDVKHMIDLIRKYDVKEIWGGGWGIDTPGAKELFDRTFTGHGEQAVFPLLKDRWQGHRHPKLLGDAHIVKLSAKLGYLYSIRGCKYKCEYCPSPAMVPEMLSTPISEIKKLLDYYLEKKVSAIIIYDETFLQDKQYSERVVEMLNERGLLWFCLTSSTELKGQVSKLRDKGFLGCLMGIESLCDKTLLHHKRGGRLTSLNMDVIKEMKDNSCYLIGTYIFCHELDTEKSMRDDIEKLASMDIPAVMPTILTPYPGTPPFERYADRIIDWDWTHWDDGHLVWRHDSITPEVGKQVLSDCYDQCNSLSYNMKFVFKEVIRNVIPFTIKRRFFGKKFPVSIVPSIANSFFTNLKEEDNYTNVISDEQKYLKDLANQMNSNKT